MLGRSQAFGYAIPEPQHAHPHQHTNCSKNLGMDAIVFNVGHDGWTLEFEDEAIMSGSTVEHVKEAAPVLGKYFDILGVRTFPSLKNKEDDYSELIY
jgi:N-succinyl-L-ornithine transcarbamylase